ncbi:hypothetical protein [Pseudomonas sp. GL-B-19]|uniref:hypothetical protein n=1 Tax=Pseudomonas sp. GL-B-19 TaxID=2832393 RepID=UPI001CBCC192|nr:hypothetical protein [Pseudomonas sp. GL-B-19]
MIHYSSPDQIKACRALALERNRQMFEEAQNLSRCAFELLDGGDLDVELFDRYQALRRKADSKFQEAIEHLQLLNEDFPPIPLSASNSHQLRQQLEHRA